MTHPRQSGILLHPTSLPGPHGAGDFGAAAYRFVDWLAEAGQTLWQVLPLGQVGAGNSPYMSPSAFAGNELLIDLAPLRDAGWLADGDLYPVAGFDERRVNYALVADFRRDRLRRAAARFLEKPTQPTQAAFTAFCEKEAGWLDDYALFMTLAEAEAREGRHHWQEWPASLARRDPKALKEAAHAHASEVVFRKFCQWQFFGQWASLKAYANSRGIDIVGDMPIFVAPQSADVWANPELFELDAQGWPQAIAGVPPDYFSASGQCWGNPLYRWPAHAKEKYRWWIARMKQTLRLCDVIRIDHFRGFESYWQIPAGAANAIGGRWQPGPGAAIFEALRKALGEPRIIAEDLGIITHAVTALRQAFDLPGMRVLQFAFDGKQRNPHLPHLFDAATVVYTGTHDNDTTRGWWNGLDDRARDLVRRYLAASGEAIHWDLIHAASVSVAALAIYPLQDVLGLDSAHRMNTPGHGHGAWEWRFRWDDIAYWHAPHLREITLMHGRIPAAVAAEPMVE